VLVLQTELLSVINSNKKKTYIIFAFNDLYIKVKVITGSLNTYYQIICYRTSNLLKMSQLLPKKEVKRFCTFNDNWLKDDNFFFFFFFSYGAWSRTQVGSNWPGSQKDDNFKSWLMKYSNEYAKCKICQIRFIVKYDGISAIKQHLNSLKHKNMNRNMNTNRNKTNYFIIFLKLKIHWKMNLLLHANFPLHIIQSNIITVIIVQIVS